MSDLGLFPDSEPRTSRRKGKNGSSRGRKKESKGRSGCAVFIAFAIVIGLLGAGGWYAYGFVKDRFGPPPDYSGAGNASDTIVVVVKPGWVASNIGNELKRVGVVKSVDAFTKAYTGDKQQRNIEASAYVMKKHQSAKSAFEFMVDRNNRQNINPGEGLRATKVYEVIAKKLGVPPAEVEAASKDPSLGLPAWANNNIEGFLFPGQYAAAPGMKPVDVLRDMVTTAKNKYTAMQLEQKAQAAGKTPYQILTIASMVQAEVRRTEDFGKVSQVIYNRLGKDMTLGLDSTVNYALNKSSLQLTTDDLKVDSPYNTRIKKGLPPTPIGNPGVPAINAALAPPQGNFVYFVTTNPETGETKFTDSYTQFQQYSNELQKWHKDNPGK
ncbi:endolytic transglycosylase MltG [Yinghuangia seranimata]|uniref:endolytic transglycosylase MltG n=1 Tax=Yinghuangia seranimata TaxID=408067 RepID=UPI00248A9F46|nr:endolytic transglycosylase MltG [Yinghuangia seranimata]MDI2132089.1 endolytic transglycosylase MltG [Yinghuangia seranimata]